MGERSSRAEAPRVETALGGKARRAEAPPEAPPETPDEQWQRYRRALAGVSLPAALVDLDALDANIDLLLAPVRAALKTLRLAT
jgi:hypothetical protein